MEEFIRVWRHLPKFLFGFLFVVSITAIVLGQAELARLVVSVAPLIDWKEIGGFASGVVVLMLLLTVSSSGLLLLDLLVDLLSIGTSRLAALEPVHVVVRRLGLAELVYPLSEIVDLRIAADGHLLLEHVLLKGQAMPEYLDKAEQLEAYMTRARAHLGNIRGTGWVQVINYYASVTQDQKKLERFEDEIRELYYLMITAMSIATALIRVGVVSSVLISALVILAISLALTPVVFQRKSWLASYIVAGFVDVFTAGAGSVTTVEDREGF